MHILLSPYLNFNGTCEEAMNFYKSVVGGKLELTKFGENIMPGHDNDQDKIMHAVLEHEMFTMMASDTGDDAVFGDSISLSLSGDDDARLRQYFDGLSAGGKITMPMAKQQWGDEFGMFTDKFGVHWMINITAEKPA